MFLNKLKLSAVIGFALLSIGTGVKASEREPDGETTKKLIDDFIEFAFDESWRSNNSQLDYINEIRPNNSPIPDTSWRNTSKFEETIYKTIPQLLKDKILRRGLFAESDTFKLIDCGVNFDDKNALNKLTPANWNYIVFVNYLGSINFHEFRFAKRDILSSIMQLLCKNTDGEVSKKLTKYAANTIYKEVNDIIDIINKADIKGIADSDIQQIKKAIKEMSSSRIDDIPIEKYLRYITLLLRISCGAEYAEKIEDAAKDIEKYINQVNIDNYLDTHNEAIRFVSYSNQNELSDIGWGQHLLTPGFLPCLILKEFGCIKVDRHNNEEKIRATFKTMLRSSDEGLKDIIKEYSSKGTNNNEYSEPLYYRLTQDYEWNEKEKTLNILSYKKPETGEPEAKSTRALVDFFRREIQSGNKRLDEETEFGIIDRRRIMGYYKYEDDLGYTHHFGSAYYYSPWYFHNATNFLLNPLHHMIDTYLPRDEEEQISQLDAPSEIEYESEGEAEGDGE